MTNALALRTLRLSATSGTRTLGSMIASTDGGAGSQIRMFKYITKKNNISPSEYYFNILGIKAKSGYYPALYHRSASGYI